ncbi:MAG: sialate O-acetylesterase [Lentisphaerae bacterium]|nr:sialate O-acetylesterase [Lentisphaerota bacterium]
MEIISGLFDNMVLQRDTNDESNASFEGKCSYSGNVMARVKDATGVLNGLDAVVAGTAHASKVRGQLKGLHVGGPYDIELWIEDKQGIVCDRLRVRNVLVGDVWVLGGQSNMLGRGRITELPEPINQVRAFFMNDQWDVAQELLHNFGITVDQIHIDLIGGVRPTKNQPITVGPGLFFAQEMFRQTDVPQGLIPCAHGGTSMAQWDPSLKSKGGKSLYGAMLRSVKKNGTKVAGLLWYQGCADALSADTAAVYTKRMITLIKNIRHNFDYPKLPVVIVQISRTLRPQSIKAIHWNSVQEQQRLLPTIIPHCATVPTIDLPLDDNVHLSANAQIHLGKRLAYAVRVLTEGRYAGEPPIEPGKIEIKKDEQRGTANVIVNYKNVVGKLLSNNRPAGFAITGNNLAECIYRTDLEDNKAILRTIQPISVINNAYVHYGLGHCPYCNITDEADRSLPVMGPMPIGEPRALTDFVQEFQVSKILPAAGKLTDLRFPRKKSDLEFNVRLFNEPFADIHLYTQECKYKDPLVYFSCHIKCAQHMQLAVCLGYDGPVKLWIDKHEAYYDPNGVNPSEMDKAKIPFKAKKGRHEIMLALGTNKKNARGIFLRFERLGLSKKILASPNKVVLPTIET